MNRYSRRIAPDYEYEAPATKYWRDSAQRWRLLALWGWVAFVLMTLLAGWLA